MRFYTRNARWHVLAIAVVGTGVALVMLLTSGDGLSNPVALMTLVACGALLALGARCTSLRVELVGRQVTVVNLAKSHRVDVCDIERVELIGSASGAIKAALFLGNGSVIECDAVQSPWLRTLNYARRRGQGVKVVEELRAAIEETKQDVCHGAELEHRRDASARRPDAADLGDEQARSPTPLSHAQDSRRYENQ